MVGRLAIRDEAKRARVISCLRRQLRGRDIDRCLDTIPELNPMLHCGYCFKFNRTGVFICAH
eukprot:2542815-Prorocentrum_lima.AAC.1